SAERSLDTEEVSAATAAAIGCAITGTAECGGPTGAAVRLTELAGALALAGSEGGDEGVAIAGSDGAAVAVAGCTGAAATCATGGEAGAAAACGMGASEAGSISP